MESETTYAPKNILVTDTHFEWADEGGRYLSLRFSPFTGQIAVTTHAPEQYGSGIVGVGDARWPGARFVIAKPDTEDFLAALERWIKS